ncbi:hypothetical protein GGTG_06018 [Gaeumannomyces tritici R3-111a-1]|uniref:Uncharacterized protein n=1 Tax=Gaeumannomyces tritici (strain R3-111a-1) TaxID=644352 RepID=J3NXL2_GAET3|nr:hypothetical protein GGTG_06018 [Gaeumannomyces tritici R3-111a-1]EJT76094.1 hypothetical protein GGTG_06018 [Gaeumannomyces tritici R3-111a-1]
MSPLRVLEAAAGRDGQAEAHAMFLVAHTSEAISPLPPSLERGLVAIAIHTYLAIIRDYRLPSWAFYLAIGLLWGLNYLAAILGIVIHRCRAAPGGLYVRVMAWTSSFRRVPRTTEGHHNPGRRPSAQPLRQPTALTSATDSDGGTTATKPSAPPPPAPEAEQQQQQQHIGKTGVPLAYFTFAGAVITLGGFLDVLLYSWTRRAIVFSPGARPPSQDLGLFTFNFMRTPPGRKLGNVVYVRGGAGAGAGVGVGVGVGATAPDAAAAAAPAVAIFATPVYDSGDGGGGGGGGVAAAAAGTLIPAGRRNLKGATGSRTGGMTHLAATGKRPRHDDPVRDRHFGLC